MAPRASAGEGVESGSPRNAGHRLRFRSWQDVQDRLSECADESKIRTSGKWSSGQIFFHLAAAIEESLVPRQTGAKPPSRLVKLPIRTVVLKRGLPRGVSIPSQVADRLTPPDDAEHAPQLRRLQAAMSAFDACRTQPPIHPVLGDLTREEWRQFHLRHCELHLACVMPHLA